MLVSENSDHRIEFRRPESLSPLLVQNAFPGTRPFIHPLTLPNGGSALTENQPAHHPWQHGLYTGLNGVNGVGFWTEGLLEKNAATDGTFAPSVLDPPDIHDSCAHWQVKSLWRAPNGDKLLHEAQEWRLEDKRSTLQLDLKWTLTASTDLAFEQSTYGGLFLRMPWRAGTPASLLTSEGITDQQIADQTRARWVAVTMALPGAPEGAGVAFFDHPRNPEHPTPWRIDGEFGMAPSRCIAGEWRLASGVSTTSRYRLICFSGGIDSSEIKARWKEYVSAHA